MSLKIQGGIVNINEYHDNSTEFNIDARGKDLASVIRACQTEDIPSSSSADSDIPSSSSGAPDFSSEIPTREETPQEKPYSPPIPREGDYNGVRLYIEERKRYDESFKDYCSHHNRKELCTYLTKEFGWFVDDKSLGKNISRNIKACSF